MIQVTSHMYHMIQMYPWGTDFRLACFKKPASCTPVVGDYLLESDIIIIPTTKVVVSQQITTHILRSGPVAGMNKEQKLIHFNEYNELLLGCFSAAVNLFTSGLLMQSASICSIRHQLYDVQTAYNILQLWDCQALIHE